MMTRPEIRSSSPVRSARPSHLSRLSRFLEAAPRALAALMGAIVLMLNACGAPPAAAPLAFDPQSLEGTWFGAWHEAGNFGTVVIRFDSAERIYEVVLNGNMQSDTATSQEIMPGLFELYFAGGGRGIVALDESGMYAGLVVDKGNVITTAYSALQRGTPYVPAQFVPADWRARWLGERVAVDAQFDIVDAISSDVEVYAGGDYRGVSSPLAFLNNPSIFGDQLRYTDQALGTLQGGYSEGQFSAGLVLMVMSPDAQFSMMIGWAGGAPSWPRYGRFHFLRKQ